MTTVNTRVLISSEQRAHILEIDARHPGRTSSRAVRLGFEFIHTPIRDFALFCHCLGGNRVREITSAERAKLLAPHASAEAIEVTLEQPLYDAAVKHFTALKMDLTQGLSLCLWYGLLAYPCKLKSLREMTRSYPKRKDDPMSTLLNDGKTWAGQAYLAGSDPARGRCGDCEHFVAGKKELGRCLKYTELMNGIAGPAFPEYAIACKYVEETFDEAF